MIFAVFETNLHAPTFKKWRKPEHPKRWRQYTSQK